MTHTVKLESLQVACLLRMIGNQLREIDEDLNGGDTTDTTALVLNDYRDLLSSICDALTAE